MMWHMAIGWALFGALMAVFWAVAFPALRARYRPRSGVAGGYPPAGEDVAELKVVAERLQARVETLERLLDATQPEWRKK